MKYTYQRKYMEISSSWWILWRNKVNGFQKARQKQRTKLFRRFSTVGSGTLYHTANQNKGIKVIGGQSLHISSLIKAQQLLWRMQNIANWRPTFSDHFTYQNPTTTSADAKNSHFHDQSVYQYPHFLKCNVWNKYIMDPFDKSNREEFIEYISEDERTKGRGKKINHPIQSVGRL